ncbi:MAG: hypothetical protein KGL39_21645 [Patescibacteria group bacterium]|nr:hypothetical protein [Patescibacteria group bacterium]
MNATQFNEVLNALCAEAIQEGVNKKQMKLTEMIGILEVHQQNLIGLNMQRQFAAQQIRAASAQALQNLPPAPGEIKK